MRSLFGFFIGLAITGGLVASAPVSAAIAASHADALPAPGFPTPSPPPSAKEVPFPRPDSLVTPLPIASNWLQVNCTTTPLVAIYRLAFADADPGTRFAHPLPVKPTQVWVRNPLVEPLRSALQRNPSRIPIELNYCIGHQCFFGDASMTDPVYAATEVVFRLIDVTQTGSPMDPAPGFGCPTMPPATPTAPSSSSSAVGSSPSPSASP